MTSVAKGTRRVTQILDFVAKARSAHSQQIVEHLAAPRSSVYDLLRSLLQREFLQRNTAGQWKLGEEVYALGMSRFGLGDIASELLSELATLQAATQESAQLVVLENTRLLVTHAFNSLRCMPAGMEVGAQVPLAWTAAGQLFTSGRNEAKTRGYATGSEHSDQAMSSIAAAVFEVNGRVVAAVRLVLPTARLANHQDSLISLVCGTAARLSHRLAYQSP